MWLWAAGFPGAIGLLAIVGTLTVPDGSIGAAFGLAAFPLGLASVFAMVGISHARSRHCPFCGRRLVATPAVYFEARGRVARPDRLWCESCSHIEVDRVCL